MENGHQKRVPCKKFRGWTVVTHGADHSRDSITEDRPETLDWIEKK